MKCKGNSVKSVKNRITKDVIAIIEKNKGIVTDKIVLINDTNLNNAIKEIKDYIRESFGDAIAENTFFLKKNTKTDEVFFSFPKNLENILKQKEELNKKQDKAIQQAVIEHTTYQEAKDYIDAQPIPENDVFDDPLFFTPALDNTEVSDFTDSMYDAMAPDVPFDIDQNSIDVENGNASYQQYVLYKKDLLEKIKRNLSKFKITNKAGTLNSNKIIKNYNQTIEKLNREIIELESNKNNIDVIYNDVFSEINYLNNILDTITIDSFDVTELLRRIDNLVNFFTERGKEQTRYSNIFAVNAHKDYDVINTRISSLQSKWEKKQGELIKNIMEENVVVQQHIREGKLNWTDKDGNKLSGKETLDVIKKYIENPTDTSSAMANFYGAARGGDIFGQILKLEMEVALRNRQGKTGAIVNRIDKVYEKLREKAEKGLNAKEKKDLNIIDEFIQKDSLGVKTEMLISKFSNEWFKEAVKISLKMKAFFKGNQEFSVKSENYKNMMIEMKSKEDFLDISKLKYFRNNPKYNNSITSQYFTHSESDMDIYEADLIKKLGINFFKELVKKQEEKLNEWIETVANDAFASSKFKTESNPFVFVNHFYSDKYYIPVDENFIFSSYSVYFPLSKSRSGKTELNYYNEDFDKIEKDADKYEFWSLVNNLLTEYINTELQANGERIKIFELPQIQDLINNEIIKNTSTWKEKGVLWSKNLWNSFAEMSANSSYENLNDEKDNKLRTGYSNTVTKRKRELEKLLKTNSVEKLSEIANNEGIKYDINEYYYSKVNAVNNNEKMEEIKKFNSINYLTNVERDRLAKAIANKRTLSKTDENFIIALRGLAAVTDNLASRKHAENIANIMKNYVDNIANPLKSNKATKLANTSYFLETFIKRNIYLDTLHGDRKKDNEGNLKTMGKIWSKKTNFLNFNKVFNFFGINIPAADWSHYLSTEDKKFKEFLLNEIKDIDNKENFDFEYNEVTYSTKNGLFYKKAKGKRETGISIDEIKNVYASYLGEKAENLGIDRTLGSLFSGFMSIMVQKALWLNPKSGFRNLWEGGTKNMQVAASGRYGFGLPELQNAKDFLWGINTDRYLETFAGQKMLSINKSNEDHANNIKTYKMLIEQFGLIQDRKNEFVKAEDYDSKKKKFKFSMMDFAVENPEAHNQGELVLSKLQKIYIQYTDKDGTVREQPVFDGDSKQFIFVPGTMTLRDEYRTEENIRMWENFLESKGENNQHLTTIIDIQAMIERTQGNYNDKDIIAIQGSTLGRMLMTFKRFYPEHIWQNFGQQDFDLIKGETNFKGRKRVMIENAPVTAAYLAACGALSLTGGNYSAFICG